MILIKQLHQKSVIFVFNRCHDLLMMFINLSNIANLSIKGSDYGCIVSLISKDEAKMLIQNADLAQKKVEHYEA